MAVWMLLYARKDDEADNDKNVNALLQNLSLLRKQSVNDESTIVYIQDGLSAIVLPNLRELCCMMSLPVSGTKSILIERILVSQATLRELTQRENDSTTVLYALMKTWFMKPFQSKACREGTLNEPFILSNFASFVFKKSMSCLQAAGRQITIVSIHEFGLLCHHGEMMAAFSPDGIAGVVENSNWASLRYAALVEMKSKCTEATLHAEKELVDEFIE